MRWWMIIPVIALIAFWVFAGDKPQTSQRCESVTPEVFAGELAERGGSLVDVRTPKEFAEGHLAGAVNVNFYDEDFAARMEAMAKDQPVFVYCRSGGRSGKTLAILKEAGFQFVLDMSGGVMRWQKEGRELVMPDAAPDQQ